MQSDDTKTALYYPPNEILNKNVYCFYNIPSSCDLVEPRGIMKKKSSSIVEYKSYNAGPDHRAQNINHLEVIEDIITFAYINRRYLPRLFVFRERKEDR